MTTRHDKAVIERLMRIPGAKLQGDVTVSDSPDHVLGVTKKVKPVSDKKPKKKSLSMTNEYTKGIIVCVKNNKRVKYWR